MMVDARSGFLLTRRRTLALGALAGALTFTARRAGAVVRLDITEGNFQPLPIAIPKFLAGGQDDGDTANAVTQIVTANLQRSGLFAPIDPTAYIERIASVDAVPRFPDWRNINAQALVTGRIGRQADGRLQAEFRLWDVLAGQQLDGKQYLTTPDNWRRIAHIISDAIYERLTGQGGYFDTRVVFVDETGPAERRVKRLAIMDQDGANVRYLTRGDELVLTPRFSPSTQEITYMAYGQGDPRVYLYNIETGQREIVGNFPGMSFSPRFSPDGQRVIMSLQEGGNSNLFVMDLRSKATTRLTDTQAIDTAPSYSPDGSRICFESDRGGRQQIYVMNAGGGAAQRISFGDGTYSTPVWSPRGDYIAFTRQSPVEICHRRNETRWNRRAHSHRRIPQRRPHLFAERAGDHVFPRPGRQCRSVVVFSRYFRAQRAASSNAELCVRPGLVAAIVVSPSGSTQSPH